MSKITFETAQELAKGKGVALFEVGDTVTVQGTPGVISEVSAYGQSSGLWWGWGTYHVRGAGFGHGGMLVDFTDAHFTSGGTVKAA